MRRLMLATILAAIAAPAAALNPPAAPATSQPARELPADFLDLDGTTASDDVKGSDGDDSLSGGDRGARRADLSRECKESSGTTGLILGAVAGGILGNVIDGGGKRTAGTLLGAGGGALLGRHIEQSRAAAGCK